MDAGDYGRYYGTLLRRRRRRGVDPYRQYCVSLGSSGLLPSDDPASLVPGSHDPVRDLAQPVSWHLDTDPRQHPSIGVSGYQLTDGNRPYRHPSEVRCRLYVL